MSLLVKDAVVFSHPVPLTAASSALMPAVDEPGRSKVGPPSLVAMPPGLVVVPPAGLASNDSMVRPPVPLDECRAG